jgi:hypothetical protein
MMRSTKSPPTGNWPCKENTPEDDVVFLARSTSRLVFTRSIIWVLGTSVGQRGGMQSFYSREMLRHNCMKPEGGV